MSVLSSLKNDSAPRMMFNTGTLYDLMTGHFLRGKGGKWYLNGGLPPAITGVHGAGNMFKSTLMDSLIMGSLRIYTDADYFIYDTEGSKTKPRVLNFMSDILHDFVSEDDLESRVTLKNDGDEIDIINVLFAEINKIRDLKNDNIKELGITLPFMDPGTGRAMECILPTYASIDSLTEVKSTEEGDMIAKDGLESSKNKTIWMVDGNKKTSLVRHIRTLASKFGICFLCSAHKGKNMDMGSHLPPKKQLQFMKQADRMKGVGSRFEFLTHSLVEVASARTSLDSNKEAKYPKETTSSTDINELLVVIQRGKGNSSGTMVTFIVSQEHGLLNTCTNYNFLRDSKVGNAIPGLIGSASSPKHECVWYPETKFSRKSIRLQEESDYKLARALELTAQYRYIQCNWNLNGLPFNFNQTFEEVYDKLIANEVDMGKVLETTGYWNYRTSEREYMSIFDLMELALPKSEVSDEIKERKKVSTK